MRISVVIPVKDDDDLLARCLESLRLQRRPADEIIVVDNASTDDSAAVARYFGTTVIREEKPGITAATSAGLDAARGDVLARCDADCVLPAGWLERIEGVLSKHPEAVAVTGPGRFYDLGPLASTVADLLYMRAYFTAAKAATVRTPLFGSNYAVRAEAWREVAASVPRDEPDLHDDFDLSFRLDAAQPVIYDRDLVVGISGRPFRSVSSLALRMQRAYVTIAENVPERAPWRRWGRRISAHQETARLSRPEVEE